MERITAPEMRGANETRHALYARTGTGIVIGGSWLRKRTPDDATAVTGPHRPKSRLADKVLYRVALPAGLIVVAIVLAAT